jgi:serine/threonine protein kinase
VVRIGVRKHRIGSVLANRYEVGPVLGLGGSAEVRRAWDRHVGRPVAIKLFTGPAAPGMGCAHERETGALTGLDHPGLVALHDTGVVAGRPYAVMELVEGPSLDDVLRRGPMRVPEVTQLGASIADAIAYVHCRGVVHRDVKPGNILLGADGAPRLSDFGLARVVDAARLTTTGVIEGTPAYIAPEQVRGEAVGPAADVYALGLVLLEALTGRREYDGPPIEAALARLFRDPKVPGDLCGGLAEVLPRMVMRDPDTRPSASEVADALRMGSAAAAAAA